MSAKKADWVPQQVRLNAYERETILRLAMLIDFAEDVKKTLQKRAQAIPQGVQRIGMIESSAKSLLNDFVRTMTDHDAKRFQRELKSFSYHTGVKDPVTMGKQNRDGFGMWVSFESLNRMFDGMADHCMMCGKDAQQEGSCPIRKALDNMGAAVDVDAPSCPYRELIGFNR